MTYLSTAEVAEIKGCSLRYVQQLVQNGKLMGETKDNAANNRTEYMIPLTALPQDLQLKWENQQRRSLGLEPIKKAVKAPLKPAENRLTLDDLTDKQRSELYLWTGIIKDWLTIRDSYEQFSKGEIDEMFVQAARLKYGFVVYVNGFIRAEWSMNDCEIRRRFYYESKKSLLKSSEKAKIKKMRKSVREEIMKSAQYSVFLPYWGSFSRLKAHLIKNNKSIELVKYE